MCVYIKLSEGGKTMRFPGFQIANELIKMTASEILTLQTQNLVANMSGQNF